MTLHGLDNWIQGDDRFDTEVNEFSKLSPYGRHRFIVQDIYGEIAVFHFLHRALDYVKHLMTDHHSRSGVHVYDQQTGESITP